LPAARKVRNFQGEGWGFRAGARTGMMAGRRKSLRDRFERDDADPDEEFYALLRETLRLARETHGGRGAFQLIDSKIKALHALNGALKLDDERQKAAGGEAQDHALAMKVRKLAREGKSDDEIVDLLKLASDAMRATAIGTQGITRESAAGG